MAACASSRSHLAVDGPGEGTIVMSDVALQAMFVEGGAEDVYFRAAQVGCERVQDVVVCRAFDAHSNNPLRAAFVVAAHEGRTVVELRAIEVLVDHVDATPRLRGGNGGRRPVSKVWKPGNDPLTTRRMLKDLCTAPAGAEVPTSAPPPLAPSSPTPGSTP